MLTQKRLKELLIYCPVTGQFTRKVPVCNVKAGSLAGNNKVNGYREVAIDNKSYLSHRLAYLYMVGRLPTEDVDHIDGIRNNNAWSNLREASRSENNQNRKEGQSNNSSGLLGVCWHKAAKKWKAAIAVNRKSKHLGLFNTPEAAYQAYLKAKKELHPFSTL